MRFQNERFVLLAIILLAALMFLTGISWGLPSRSYDRYLFADRQPWSGEQIISLAGGWDESADRGADIAKHILTDRDQPIPLNDTDAKRAEIVRRFRLYSEQPDEMITFRSLSRMKPGQGDFDPRFYQYGGLWVYPVGALLKLADRLHFVTLKSDLAFYLDHPNQFGRFYSIARLYVVAWGLLGVWVVFALTKEWTGNFFASTLSAMLYALMPVVVNMAHEAKPHLPGTVLTLAACLCAMRFVRTGLPRWWILSGILCGAAFGMVLTGMFSFIILPVMTLLRPMSWQKRLTTTVFAGAIGIMVFTITNPYLPYNYLFHRAVVKSNVGNYGNFYKPELSLTVARHSLRLMVEGMSLPLMIAGVFGFVCLLVKRKMNRGWLLAGPMMLVMLQFVLLAREKPAEYARFAITGDIILAIVAASVIASIRNKTIARFTATVVVVFTAASSFRYVINFVTDNRLPVITILKNVPDRSTVIGLYSEPAPYCFPPVDLFRSKLILLPRGIQTISDQIITVRPVDVPTKIPPPNATAIVSASLSWFALSPMSWANKPFEIFQYSSHTAPSP